jgi:hypothetical protein
MKVSSAFAASLPSVAPSRELRRYRSATEQILRYGDSEAPNMIELGPGKAETPHYRSQRRGSMMTYDQRIDGRVR